MNCSRPPSKALWSVSDATPPHRQTIIICNTSPKNDHARVHRDVNVITRDKHRERERDSSPTASPVSIPAADGRWRGSKVEEGKPEPQRAAAVMLTIRRAICPHDSCHFLLVSMVLGLPGQRDTTPGTPSVRRIAERSFDLTDLTDVIGPPASSGITASATHF
ncbi:hypothetical protein EYF80_030350 [Liparis tanakae]|uniref:Uncharacterized protein n=1 Tax=Liparis tanakae TaxID=230148 RepID=A0A4Z2H2B0_9TELE|nr:hypothetical protein EYF80_030350 [Liparis tanakae]